jgi:membrane fusion protein, copper/silver efflux system
MNRTIYASTVLVLIVASFVGGLMWARRGSPAASPVQQKAIYYACPMHPQYHSDRAGDCPSCGMRLEPVYADGAGAAAPGSGGAGLPAGVIRVSSERQQAIGVRLGIAEKVSGTRTLRTTGRVAADENATYPLVSGVDARISDVRSPTVGTLVRKNELLASLYAPELLSLSQSFLIALNSAERQGTQDPNQIAAAKTNLQRAEEALRNLGVSEGQIEELRTKRQTTPAIRIASPVDGFILARNILVGQRVERGTELYRIADLRRVWILADVYENQLPFVRSGMTATITAAQQNRRYSATVSAAQPIFDEAARTMKVRLETDNDGFVLKPGMFVDVAFAIEMPATLAVPADAIVDTGLRKTLFVDRNNGFFEPRQIETGWRIGDQVEITKGLMAGERIVLSGTFLMDSESRMKAAAQGVFGVATKDPVCGMDVDHTRAEAAGRKSEYKGTVYYFCSDSCKKDFDKDPGKFATK